MISKARLKFEWRRIDGSEKVLAEYFLVQKLYGKKRFLVQFFSIVNLGPNITCIPKQISGQNYL